MYCEHCGHPHIDGLSKTEVRIFKNIVACPDGATREDVMRGLVIDVGSFNATMTKFRNKLKRAGLMLTNDDNHGGKGNTARYAIKVKE